MGMIENLTYTKGEAFCFQIWIMEKGSACAVNVPVKLRYEKRAPTSDQQVLLFLFALFIKCIKTQEKKHTVFGL